MAGESHGLVLVARTRKPVKRGRPQNRKAVGKLAKAASKRVESNCEKLAASLMKSALDGNANSVRLLVSLAESEGEDADAELVQSVRSAAQQLASEPQWEDNSDEAMEMTGGGGREPEE
jgi:hypothetical protein